MTVIATIHHEMADDGDDDSDKLLEFYDSVNDREKGVINRMLICICGWSLPTLIKMAAGYKDAEVADVPYADEPMSIVGMPLVARKD